MLSCLVECRINIYVFDHVLCNCFILYFILFYCNICICVCVCVSVHVREFIGAVFMPRSIGMCNIQVKQVLYVS
jgi:hypothetical protein